MSYLQCFKDLIKCVLSHWVWAWNHKHTHGSNQNAHRYRALLCKANYVTKHSAYTLSFPVSFWPLSIRSQISLKSKIMTLRFMRWVYFAVSPCQYLIKIKHGHNFILYQILFLRWCIALWSTKMTKSVTEPHFTTTFSRYFFLLFMDTLKIIRIHNNWTAVDKNKLIFVNIYVITF